MRISDWSSDVCSSDLFEALHRLGHHLAADTVTGQNDDVRHSLILVPHAALASAGADSRSRRTASALLAASIYAATQHGRSEERRVGTGCVSTWSSRWSPYYYKKNDNRTSKYKP